ncbi:MAG: ATP-binding protein [Bdellovibrionota bacterium]
MAEANSGIEKRKRKREIVIVFLLSFAFVFLTWFEIKLFSTSQQLPFYHSIFFFGLVNFNIIILLFLLFLIFRNLVKTFVERKSRLFGSQLKAKLVVAFVTFSSVPTLLLFVISVFYINSSFEKWFSVKTMGVLKSSLEVQNYFYFNAKKKNFHFAKKIAESIANTRTSQIPLVLQDFQKQYALDAIEYYPSLLSERTVVTSAEEHLSNVPTAAAQFLEQGLEEGSEASTIHQFGEGNLVRVITPVQDGKKGVIIVSSFIPLSLVTQINDVTSAYREFKDVNPLQYPLKSIYLIILFLMTLVILLAATWFGFHWAKQLSVPLIQLGKATERVTQGDYTPLRITSGSEEIESLVTRFNQMTENLARSETNLQETLHYLEVILKNVSTGVISVNDSGRITTINRHAADLLKIDSQRFIGRPVRELLTTEYFRTFFELQRSLKENNLESVQKELSIQINDQNVPLLMSLALLRDEEGGREIGTIVVFDDLTPILNAQRAAAWTEVARRIAHEIKNPLTPIRLAAERMHRKFGESIKDPAFHDSIRMIIQQVDDLKNLVNEFSQFARMPQTKLSPGSIQQTITESMNVFKDAHPKVKLELELAPNLPMFKFDRDQMKRVFVNLIDNAISAVEKVEFPQIVFRADFDENLRILRMTISDNGSGIHKKDRIKVFEPYYSTKTHGTGLGLAIVKRIVEDHNGFIRALANEPVGTQMLIEIPIQSQESWQPRSVS